MKRFLIRLLGGIVKDDLPEYCPQLRRRCTVDFCAGCRGKKLNTKPEGRAWVRRVDPPNDGILN